MSSADRQPRANSTQQRLGESLQAAGFLNSEQLDEAIEYQCIYGGKLGTSLIELGLIDENQLAKVLSQQLGHHYIKPELLMKISNSVLDLIPEKIALKYHVIPYHEDGKKLFVAMNEGNNLTIIDELSFQLDRIIIPLAIPEIRLMLALKKHYGLLLSPRYETLARQINRRILAAKKIDANREKNKPPSPAVSQKEVVQSTDVSTWPLLGDTPDTEGEQKEIYYHEATTQQDGRNTFNVFQQLANAHNRDDIAKAIMTHLKTDFPSSALLMVHKDIANGWLATQKNKNQPFEQIAISLQKPSVFTFVAKNRAHFLGPMIDSPQNSTILDFFSTKLPQDVLVMPLMVQNRLVCILYIQGLIDDLTRRLTEFQNIAEKIEMSFKLLILKNKILTI